MSGNTRGYLKNLATFVLLASLAFFSAGCPEVIETPEVTELEEIISYTGEIRVILPTEEEFRYTAPEPLPDFPADTLIEVISGKLEGTLLGMTIELGEGKVARLTVPALAVERVVSFTGRLRIILPTGEVILVEPGQILPPLPPGTRIVVLSGELTVISEGEILKLTVGEIGRIVEVEEFEPEIEIGVIEDRAPISPYRP